MPSQTFARFPISHFPLPILFPPLPKSRTYLHPVCVCGYEIRKTGSQGRADIGVTLEEGFKKD